MQGHPRGQAHKEGQSEGVNRGRLAPRLAWPKWGPMCGGECLARRSAPLQIRPGALEQSPWGARCMGRSRLYSVLVRLSVGLLS